MLALGALSLASCEKELDQAPYNAISQTQAFNSESDFTNAIRGAYQGFRLGSYYGGTDGGSMIITPDVLADNLIINSQGRQSQQNFFLYNYTANNTWSLWNNAYTTILRANKVLENLDNLKDGDFKTNIKAEALAIRGLAHFDLLRVYAKRFVGATAGDLGVPYVTSTSPNELPARTPLIESYNNVVKDLLAAETGIANTNAVGRLNKPAVQGLLGRVYLYMGQWQNAIDKSTLAIDNAPANRKLATFAQFPSIWLDQTEQEVLFKVKILDSDNTSVGVGYGQSSPQGVRPEYSPTFELVNAYASTDVRKDVYIGQTTFNGKQFNYIKKYAGRASGNANVVDVKVIRLSEVYLNRAEAYARLNQDVKALQDLNEIRSRRYSDFNPITSIETGTSLLNAILLQRRLELAFEGHRFFDLKRLGLAVTRTSSGDFIDGTGAAPAVNGIEAGSPKFALPIPQSELDVNKNITQNGGY
jgi:starch-binding outer membrane protein, SusD/RagB family